MDNISKYQWGERCERNEALGRKKNHLIERTKYQSAIRNARKWEIRKRSLTSKVDPETAAIEGGWGTRSQSEVQVELKNRGEDYIMLWLSDVFCLLVLNF